MGNADLGPGRLILVVDDHEDFRVAMQHLLETLGCRVTCASDGVEALAKLETEPISVILTDLFMPNMDGLEFLRRLGRAEKPVPPVIAVTGDMHVAALSVGRTAAMLGAKAVLMKPFSKEQLASAIGFVSSPKPADRLAS